MVLGLGLSTEHTTGANVGSRAPRHCLLLIQGAGDSHQPDNKSELPQALLQCSVKLPKPPLPVTEGDVEATTS